MSEERLPKVFVVTHPDNGDRVGLWERNPAHPGGEVFVFGQDSDPVEVAMTSAVLEALAPSGDRGEGSPRLVRVEGGQLEARRSLAQRSREAANREGQVLALRTGRTPTELEDDEKRLARSNDLEEQVRTLQRELSEERTKHAQELSDEADKELSDPKRREERADELEKLNAAAINPDALERNQADEPRQHRMDEPVPDAESGGLSTGGTGQNAVGPVNRPGGAGRRGGRRG